MGLIFQGILKPTALKKQWDTDHLFDLYVNDVKVEVTYTPRGDLKESTVYINYLEKLNIELRNNDIANVFNLETLPDSIELYDRKTDSYTNYPIKYKNKEPDKITITIDTDNPKEWGMFLKKYGSKTNWDDNRSCYLDFTKLKLGYIPRPAMPTEEYPFIKIYSVDYDSLEMLNQEVKEFNQELQAEDKPMITDYVSSLYRIPYNVESESDSIPIQIANKGFQTTGKQITNYLQKINLGSIEVKHDVLNGIGYKNIEFLLFIPNFKPIELEVEQVIGRTLDIYLLLDITTGKGTINVKIDDTVNIVETEYIGKEIPFRADKINITIGTSVLETDFINPYILMTVLEPDNKINMELIKQRGMDTVLPVNYSYIKTEKALLNTTATKTEQLEIEHLLRHGVYIHGNY